MTSYDVTIRNSSQTAAILDPPSWISKIFQKPSKTTTIDQVSSDQNQKINTEMTQEMQNLLQKSTDF